MSRKQPSRRATFAVTAVSEAARTHQSGRGLGIANRTVADGQSPQALAADKPRAAHLQSLVSPHATRTIVEMCGGASSSSVQATRKSAGPQPGHV
jgi:muramoyltetrapeptide carboxypeptidase LdcA involved in peptidoglycan recycling